MTLQDAVDDAETSSSSAQPPFHSNPDILEEICEYLAIEDDFTHSVDVSLSRRDLLSVALTCKAFVEPALNRLWRSLDSLFPLLKILPAFVQSDGTYVLRGSISPEDWARFDMYAGRVRRFCYARDPPELDIAMHVYFRLAQLRSTPMLPSLRHLYCPSTSQDNFLVSGICLFLSPSLQSIELGDISNMEDKLCGTVLHTLLSEGAQMEKIVLRGRKLTRDTIGMAIKFENLRVLTLTGMGETLNMDFIEKIGSLPWLLELGLDFTNSPVTEIDTDIGLKDLKALMINAPMRFTQELLSHISTPHLEELVIASPPALLFDKKQFLEEIAVRWKDTLRRIALVHQHVGDEAEELSVAVLAPLIPLRKLTYLRLEGYSMELNDEIIGGFARAWPELITLFLPYIGAGHTRPTIAALRLLAVLSPRLRNLRIPLDTNDHPPFVSTGSPQEPVHELQQLIIATADDPWDLRTLLHLARHIDYCFPKLRSVLPYENRDEDRWMQVHEMIQMYQTIRWEERSLKAKQ